MTDELLVRQKELHTEAKSLLEEVVLPILKEFGEVRVGGSYAYELLSYPDIDIDIINSALTSELYDKLCLKLTSDSHVVKFKTLDRTDRAQHNPDNRPIGYWLSPTIQYGKNLWKIDIWLQKPEWYTGETSRYSEKLKSLTEEDRVAVLSLKNELMKADFYGVGKEFNSAMVYDAVIGGVKTAEELREWKLKRS